MATNDLPVEAAKRVLANPQATEYLKRAAREVLEDFCSGRNDHPFSEFLLPMEEE
jgi:hypothetical protein